VDDVLITGAAGLIGTILREGLADRYAIRGIDRDPRGDRTVRRVDLRRRRALARAFAGADAVVHLAEVAGAGADWATVYRNNVRGTINALEAARLAGARRFVYASSNHVTGGYEEDEPYSSIVGGRYEGLRPDAIPLLDARAPIRPDSPYGAGKAFGEAAARHYADQHGLRAICLRIGTVKSDDRPTRPRHYATLLTHADLVRLVAAALEAPEELRFAVVYGVSANTWRFWDVADAEAAIGYVPQDDAEAFRD
jgi:nucleoside-diphosphate-sugar epimerase